MQSGSVRVFLLALPLTLFALSASAVSIVEVERSVFITVFVEAFNVASDTDGVTFESDAAGDFLQAAVGGARIGDFTSAAGESLQESSVETPGGGLRAEAGGSAGIVFDVMDPGFASFARGTATNVLSLVFEVENASAYTLAAELLADLDQLSVLSAGGAANADTLTAIEFRSLGDDTLLFDSAVEDTEANGEANSQSLVWDGVLAPGFYSLLVKSRVSLSGVEDAAGFGTAGYGVSLIVAPEPSSLLLAGVGLCGLALYARRFARA